MSKIYDNPKYNVAFDRCIDIMTKLMLKYGNQVLEQHQTAAPVSLQEQPDTEQTVLLLTLLKSLQFTRCVIIKPMV